MNFYSCMPNKVWENGFLFFLFITLNNVAGYSQGFLDTAVVIKSADVKWESQFPAIKDKSRQKHKKRNIFSLIIGDDKDEMVLSKPMNVFSEDPGNFWVIDQGNETIFRIRGEKSEVPRVFSRQKWIFQSLVGICSIPGKGILFTDSRLNKIYFLKNDFKKIEILGDSVLLNQPTGIAYSSASSEIWVVETAAHCITILDETGRKIRSIGNRGAGNGEFNFPTSIWIDKKGYAYVVDALNYRIQIFDSSGKFMNAFGEAGDATGNFAMPKSVATDSYGNIFVTDALFHAVQIFDNRGRLLYTFGSQGRGQGEFWLPTGIFIDKQDNIYVADSYNSRVQIFKLINIVKGN